MFLLKFLVGGLVGRLVSLVLLVAIVGAGGWWFFIREDHSLATNAPIIPDSVKSAATPAAGGTTTGGNAGAVGKAAYTIVADQSEAAYFAGEKLARLSLPSTAKGTTKEITGGFALTKDGLDTSATTSFTVGLTKLKSDESQRDSRVQGALQTSKFPTAVFTATKLTGFPAEFPAGQDVAMQLSGTLDLHGVKKDVTWDVKARKEGAGFSALATLKILYSDFGITKPDLAGFVSVNDDVTLQVQIVAQAG
jgi:polyisoprenoid-binding protein YceI